MQRSQFSASATRLPTWERSLTPSPIPSRRSIMSMNSTPVLGDPGCHCWPKAKSTQRTSSQRTIDRGFHVLAGQAWSLLTPTKVGVTPRQENDPLTIDYNQVVGFDFTRNWQVRLVKDFDKTLWLGVSIENPAALTASGNIPSNVNGILVNFSNVGGGGGFLTGVAVTTDQAPDIIVKAALDPGWGHYEVFGIQRFFTDSTFCSSVVPTGCVLNAIDRKTSHGTGVQIRRHL